MDLGAFWVFPALDVAMDGAWGAWEISRELRVSRTTVHKVVRSDKTAFKYVREVQPSPKLGEWVEVLTEILEAEGALPRRERRSTQGVVAEMSVAGVLI